MEKNEFKYEINGRSYTLKPLVLGQIGQITDVLKGIEITSAMGPSQIVGLLDDRLPEALAVVLTEDGKRLKDKDIATLAEEIREYLAIDTAMEIVDHFFSLNPIASALEKLTGTMKAITSMMVGSKRLLSSSPEETLQAAIGSSGDTPRKNASRTSKSDRAGNSSGRE